MLTLIVVQWCQGIDIDKLLRSVHLADSISFDRVSLGSCCCVVVLWCLFASAVSKSTGVGRRGGLGAQVLVRSL